MFVMSPGVCRYVQIVGEVPESDEPKRRRLAGDGEFLRAFPVDSGLTR